jgi:hypothetical protein
MPTDAQTLVTQARCYLCDGVTLFQAMKLSLLAQIAVGHNPSADVSAQALITAASCYSCASYSSLGDMMELALLQIIATP